MPHPPPAQAPSLHRSQRAVMARPEMTIDVSEIRACSVLDSLHKPVALPDVQGSIVPVNRDWCGSGLADGATKGVTPS